MEIYEEIQRKSIADIVLKIQKPQLYGIIAGITVFCLSVLVIFVLLIRSGTIAGFLDQLQREREGTLNSGKEGNTMSGEDVWEQSEEDLPELYDDLIKASRELPLIPLVPEMRGHTVGCRGLREDDYEELTRISDGSAQFHECAYEPWSIWRSLIFKSRASIASATDKEEIVCSKSGSTFKVTKIFLRSCYDSTSVVDCSHIVVLDKETDRLIGMVSLVDNSPRNLTVRLDNLWITPAFQSRNIGCASSSIDLKSLVKGPSRRIAKETLFILLTWLFETCKYRRVTMEVDLQHTIMQKFANDSGFLCEGTLRKHRVVRKRSRDVQIYSMLNSDWKLGAKEALRLRCNVPRELDHTASKTEEKEVMKDKKV